MPTHEVSTVCIRVLYDKSTNRLIFRPVRNQRTPIWANRDTNKWKDVWMPKLSPNGSLFAESLGRKSEEMARWVKYDDRTDPAPPFTGGKIWNRNVDSHRTTLVSPFVHPHGCPAVLRGHPGFVAVRDFGGFRDIIVLVTQLAQLIESSCSSPFV